MRKLLYIFIIIVAMVLLLGDTFCKISFAVDCQNVEGQIQIWNGWPPWIRIESKDKKSVFGIETDEAVTKSVFMPASLLQKLQTNGSLDGTFCIMPTGAQTSVPYYERAIKYVKVVSYKLRK